MKKASTLDEFQMHWPSYLDLVKTQVGVTAEAYLHNGYPVDFSDKEITIQFDKEFHHAKACQAKENLPFDEILQQYIDKSRKMVFTHQERKT